MKESTFTLLMAVGLCVTSLIVDDETHTLTASLFGFALLCTSSICRAIERNGRGQ